MRWLTISLLVLSLASCSVLEPKPDLTRSYLLTEATPPAAAVRSDLVLAIGPIGFPAYLDRAEMVTRVSSNKLRYSSRDRWAEPLSDSFTRVFVADLSNELGAVAVVAFPAAGVHEVDYRVSVGVEQFERRGDGVAVLVARWQLRHGWRGEIVQRARTTREVRIDGTATADAVEALSRAVAELAGEIAAAIVASQTTP